jgi:hypothetical protein
LQASSSASWASTAKLISSDALRRHSLAAAYVAALIPALFMAVTQPVWSRIDEAQHADFIVQLSQGVYPLVDRTTLAPETLELMKKTGIYRGLPKGTYPVPDISDIGPPPAGMSAVANAAWMKRHLWQMSFEAVQMPGYYVLMVPFWRAADSIAGPLGAVYTLRIINALLVALLAPMAVYVASRLWPGRAEVSGLAAVFAILLPGLALNGTRISNDTLAAVLGGLAIVLALRWMGRPWPWHRVVLLGAVLGAGVLVKLTVVGLAPAIVMALLWPDGVSSLRQRLYRPVIAGYMTLVGLLPWFLINLRLYGSVTPGWHAARLADAPPSAFSFAFIPFDVAVFDLTYWSGEPIGVLPLTVPFAVLGGLISLMAVAAVLRIFRERVNGISSGPLWVAALAAGGMAAGSLLLPAAAGFQFAGPGRYAYTALPAGAALCAIGLYRVLRPAWTRRAVIGVYAVTAATMLGASAAGLPIDVQAGSGVPPAQSRIVGVDAANHLEGLSIRVNRIALDPAAHVTWIEVSATNEGRTEAEWGVVPVVSVDGVIAYGDYWRSTRLPGDIDPGQTVTGWVLVPLDSSHIRAQSSLTLRFTDVAVDSYRTVGDVELHASLMGV